MGQVYATSDRPLEDEKEKTFFLYWRGRLPAGQPELTIQYQATQRFPLAQSKPNGFFYGYRIMPDAYSDVVVDLPHACNAEPPMSMENLIEQFSPEQPSLALV